MNDSSSRPIGFGRVAAMFPVRDMARAHAFYVGVLGFMILKKDGAEIHLTLQKDHKAAPFNIAHMMVADVDAFHELCRSHRLRIVKGLRDKDYGLRAFVFEDPDGNRIDVGQPI